MRWLPLAALSAVLAACGGGGGDSSSIPDSTAAAVSVGDSKAAEAQATPTTPTTPSAATTAQEARRFLTQATFGPTDAGVAALMGTTYETWIDRQLSTAPTVPSHLAYIDGRTAAIRATNPTSGAWNQDLTHSFWRHAISGNDQLRQRVTLALSEIFVVSWADGCGGDSPRSLASYMDMLAANSFGNYRQLIEKVALHPMMGCYLSHLRNQKEDLVTGRVPDENFARELMQLFSIGLYKLKSNGELVLNSAGQPVETYTADDVSGLAQVFTGWSLSCPETPLTESCFRWGINSSTKTSDPNAKVRPMVAYAQYHSTSAKKFLGTTIPAQSSPSPETSLKLTLDVLAKHPNVGPFISKQLIQRLVTSNPSSAYVGRVSQVFQSSGGNLGAVVKAILLDPDARASSNFYNTKSGKVREPILRFTALLRAYGVTSDSGKFLIDPTDDASTSLGQTAYKSPSVFNFFRPGYIPPGGATAKAGLVAPELQILNESSTAGYVNYIRDTIDNGVGRWGMDGAATRKDVQLEFLSNTNSSMRTLADQPEALVDNINAKLMYGTMPAALKSDIVNAISTIANTSAKPTAYQIGDVRIRRIKAALLLTMASPEFQVQK